MSKAMMSPFSGIDVEMQRRAVQVRLRRLCDRVRQILSGGVTGILVSHSISQVREMCNKVLWLDKGRQIAFGETKEICDRYQRFLDGEIVLE